MCNLENSTYTLRTHFQNYAIISGGYNYVKIKVNYMSQLKWTIFINNIK